MKKDCWNCKNDYRYEKFPCDYCHSENINDFWKPKDEMKDFAIEELEEIKTEIHQITMSGLLGTTLVRVEKVDNIIDNRIKKLNNE